MYIYILFHNAMLFSIKDRPLHRLEIIQRSAAQIVVNCQWNDDTGYGQSLSQSTTTVYTYFRYFIYFNKLNIIIL